MVDSDITSFQDPKASVKSEAASSESGDTTDKLGKYESDLCPS